MGTRRALLVTDPASKGEAYAKEYAKLLVAEKFKVEHAGKLSWKQAEILEAAKPGNFELVVVDIEMPRVAGVQFFEKIMDNGVPLMVMVDSANLVAQQKNLAPFVGRPLFDWVRKPTDVQDFRLHVMRAMAQRAAAQASSIGKVKVASGLDDWSMVELRSGSSGRLDAMRVARYFGWSKTTVSRAVGATIQAVSKTPDSKRIQKRLEKLERAALLARRCLGSDKRRLKQWLNSPMPDLDGEKPGEVLAKDVDVVVQWLEDAVLGQPS